MDHIEEEQEPEEEPEPVYGTEMKEVMGGWDYPRLKIAPCRYASSMRLTIWSCAPIIMPGILGILRLLMGEWVCFTDMDGVVTAYEVVSVEILEPTAVEEMTDGGYDLTLFTCTYGGQSRVTVRCSRAG